MEQTRREPTPEPDAIVAPYANLGRRITNWTSNLLATAIVIVIALVAGTQLISYWVPNGARAEVADSELADAWPALDACSLQFGAAPFELIREQMTGDEEAVKLQLQNHCRRVLEDDPLPARAIGPQEQKMIESSVELIPVEQRAGKWRIFHSQKFAVESDGGQAELSSQLPIVLGIRDDCPDQSSESGMTSRLVVWGIALAGEDETWTTYVGKSAPQTSLAKLPQNWIPANSRRTLAISDKNGGSLIGFVGGPIEEAIDFYDRLATENGWTLSSPWQKSNKTWVARFTPQADSPVAGIQVQLHLNHNEQSRGILLVQSKSTHKGS